MPDGTGKDEDATPNDGDLNWLWKYDQPDGTPTTAQVLVGIVFRHPQETRVDGVDGILVHLKERGFESAIVGGSINAVRAFVLAAEALMAALSTNTQGACVRVHCDRFGATGKYAMSVDITPFQVPVQPEPEPETPDQGQTPPSKEVFYRRFPGDRDDPDRGGFAIP